MSNYEVLLERCKREDTKELIIQCLDKASIDNNKQVKDDFVNAMQTVGVIIVSIIIIMTIIHKVIGR